MTRTTGANFNDQDRMATEVWVCSRSASLTCQGGVKRGLDEEAVPLILEVGGGGSVPTEIQISPGGTVQTESKGSFVMDADAQAAVMAAFTESGRDLVIDYEHQSLGEGEAPAAGWITRLIAKGADGLWAAVTWTERAAQYLTAREYRYLSPVLLVRKSDRRGVQLHSIGMTNTPEIRKLVPIVAKAGTVGARFIAPEPDKEEQMRERLIAILKLSADATEEAILAALDAIVAKAGAVTAEVLQALELKADATQSETVAAIHALKQTTLQAGSLDAMQAELTALKQQAAERTRDELVQAALSSGKITQAQTEWAREYALRDPDGFSVFVAKAPVVVPVGGALSASRASTQDVVMDDTQRRMNQALGVSDELFLKHTPKAA